MRKLFIILLVIVFVSIGVYLVRDQIMAFFFAPTQTSITPGVDFDDVSIDPTEEPDIEVVAENLEVPWEIAFLPNGEILVTERPGRLVKIGQDRQIIEINGVQQTGEGGLMGLAIDPDFNRNQQIYLYLTAMENGRLVNRIERYELQNDSVTNREVILDGIIGARVHDGGRLEFGPDGYLYATTGDAGNEDSAQRKESLNGKILRIHKDGSIPADNPFGNAVWSYGHRNSQGLAWGANGNLWSTEHGPSGTGTGFDEVNLIEAGKNYGWPIIQGDEMQDGMVSPVIQSGSNDTWAPGDVEIVDNKMYFTGLRGVAIYSAEINGETLTNLRINFLREWGRLRAVRVGPDGYLYVTTSNRDGRGDVGEGDDQLIKIHPSVFN